MSSSLRDTAFGGIVRLVTRNKAFQYSEELPGFTLPDTWLQLMDGETPKQAAVLDRVPSSSGASSASDDEEKQAAEGQDAQPYEKAGEPSDRVGLQRTKSREETMLYSRDRLEVEQRLELEKTKSVPIVPRKTKDGAILVDWYYTDDPDDPKNWSNTRRALVTTLICLYTFVVYMSSAIYTTSESGVQEEFGVSKTQSALGLSLFVCTL